MHSTDATVGIFFWKAKLEESDVMWDNKHAFLVTWLKLLSVIDAVLL